MKSAILDLIAYMYSLIALVDVLWRVNQRYTFPKIKNVISHVRSLFAYKRHWKSFFLPLILQN